MVKKIIFVDEDNTGLSAFCAALLRKKAIESGADIQTLSRGTVVLFPEPANMKLSEAALRFGVSLEGHKACRLTGDDFEENVLILALDSTNKNRIFDLQERFASVYTVREYLGESGDLKLPLGTGADNYGTVCETVNSLMDFLLEKIADEESAG